MRICYSLAIMKWFKERGEFLTLAGLMVALAGLMVALAGLIISYIKDFKVDTQQNIQVLRQETQNLRTDTQKSLQNLRTDTQKSIEILQADIREIRTILITHIVDHHNQPLPVSVHNKSKAKKHSRRVSSAP